MNGDRGKRKRRMFFAGHENLNMTQREVAIAIGVSQQAVQQTEVKALAKFKKQFLKLCPDTVCLFADDIRAGRW